MDVHKAVYMFMSKASLHWAETGQVAKLFDPKKRNIDKIIPKLSKMHTKCRQNLKIIQRNRIESIDLHIMIIQ